MVLGVDIQQRERFWAGSTAFRPSAFLPAILLFTNFIAGSPKDWGACVYNGRSFEKQQRFAHDTRFLLLLFGDPCGVWGHWFLWFSHVQQRCARDHGHLHHSWEFPGAGLNMEGLVAAFTFICPHFQPGFVRPWCRHDRGARIPDLRYRSAEQFAARLLSRCRHIQNNGLCVRFSLLGNYDRHKCGYVPLPAPASPVPADSDCEENDSCSGRNLGVWYLGEFV